MIQIIAKADGAADRSPSKCPAAAGSRRCQHRDNAGTGAIHIHGDAVPGNC